MQCRSDQIAGGTKPWNFFMLTSEVVGQLGYFIGVIDKWALDVWCSPSIPNHLRRFAFQVLLLSNLL